MNISDITGRPMVMLGGEFVHLQRVTGDIVSEFKWNQDEPVMVLYRAVPSTKVGAYLIELRDAHRYANADGGPTKTLIKDCIEAAHAMGFFPDRPTVFRIATIILDGLPDLIAMPPEPQAQEDARRPVGESEMTVKLDGTTIIEKVV